MGAKIVQVSMETRPPRLLLGIGFSLILVEWATERTLCSFGVSSCLRFLKFQGNIAFTKTKTRFVGGRAGTTSMKITKTCINALPLTKNIKDIRK